MTPSGDQVCQGKMNLSVGRVAAGRDDSAGRGALVAVGRRGGPGLCCAPNVPMMQAADFGSRHDRAHLGPLDGSHVGRVLLEREVSARPVVVREVAGQDAAEVPLAENEDMVQTLAPD